MPFLKCLFIHLRILLAELLVFEGFRKMLGSITILKFVGERAVIFLRVRMERFYYGFGTSFENVEFGFFFVNWLDSFVAAFILFVINFFRTRLLWLFFFFIFNWNVLPLNNRKRRHIRVSGFNHFLLRLFLDWFFVVVKKAALRQFFF